MIFTVLLIGVVIFIHRCCTTERVVAEVESEEEYGYRLNDSLYNSLSDFPAMKSMERHITRWMSRNNGASRKSGRSCLRIVI